MRTTWEKFVHHVGTIHGHDISNELLNKKTVIIEKPTHTQDVLDKHESRVIRHDVRLSLLPLLRRSTRSNISESTCDSSASACKMATRKSSPQLKSLSLNLNQSSSFKEGTGSCMSVPLSDHVLFFATEFEERQRKSTTCSSDKRGIRKHVFSCVV
jgi:hypothetical protein